MPETTPSPVCPICGKPTLDKYQPFCSGRCMTLDLGKWLGEGYRIETDETEEGEAGDKAPV